MGAKGYVLWLFCSVLFSCISFCCKVIPLILEAVCLHDNCVCTHHTHRTQTGVHVPLLRELQDIDSKERAHIQVHCRHQLKQIATVTVLKAFLIALVGREMALGKLIIQEVGP